jgi:hypothetical protein
MEPLLLARKKMCARTSYGGPTAVGRIYYWGTLLATQMACVERSIRLGDHLHQVSPAQVPAV